MTWRPWSQFLVIGLTLGSVPAQTNKPPADTAKLIRVQIGNSQGLGGGNAATIEPFFMITESEGVFNNKYFHLKVKNAITKRQWRLSSDPDGRITLRYLRVVETDCDLDAEKSACWEKVRKKYVVQQVEAPACSGYEHVTTRWVSALAYPVGVSLSPAPSRQTVAGPVKCWPVD